MQPDIEKDIAVILEMPTIASILEVICRTTGMGFAAVARVTDTKWVACTVRDEINFGLKPGGELGLETTICNEIRQHHKEVVIDHVAENETWATHHTPLQYGFQSYISIPIILKDGSFFGTLCAIDPHPAKLENTSIVEMFKLFAGMISSHIHATEALLLSEEKLKEEKELAALRELFIAVLGHDLRNPLGAIANAGQLLARMPLEPRARQLTTILQNATGRMRELIENVMDFARGRMGEGIPLDFSSKKPLKEALEEVIAEIRLTRPNRDINFDIDLKETLTCDTRRIAQMLSNLLSNALHHGAQDGPVGIKATTANGTFMLQVANKGKQISEDTLKTIFEPFSQRKQNSDKRDGGLGLGLFIVSEIAAAHGGEIQVTSTEAETVFAFTMKCSR